MRYWERKKTGFYRYCEKTKQRYGHGYDVGVLAEVAKGADGQWWMEFLDAKQGWTFKRCKSLGNAKAVAVECCK